MALSRQLMVLLCGLVLLLFAGSLAISVGNTRDYLESQLASHAQDAATSLGLAATAHVDGGDRAMVTTLVNAMFHRGDYLSIRFEDLHGAAWLERIAGLQLDDVPTWFTDLFPLRPPQRTATMMSGWRQVGRVVVISHPGLAYRQLWQTAMQTLRLFLLGALFALLAGIIGLRMLLRPLRDVEVQASAICDREFPVVEGRPFTLEFRRVVEAMNRLSARVSRMLSDSESVAADLRRQAFQDPVTGLANRRQFMDVLTHRIGDQEAFGGGGLLLLQLWGFKAYNQARGYAEGDRLLAETGRVIASVLTRQPGSTLAHLAGADFAILVENVDETRLRKLAGEIDAAVAGLYGSLGLSSPDVAHLGGAVYSGQDASGLLADADMALREAQREAANSVVIHHCVDGDAQVRSNSAWRSLIETALAHQRFRLMRQPVVAAGDGSLLHHEVFLRIPDPDRPGNEIAAAVLMPMAESAGMAVAIDKAVIELVFDGLTEGAYPGRVAVNLSPASLAADGMLEWLVDSVERRRDFAGRLILEFPEYGVALHLERLADWIGRLGALGVGFSLDHFGKGFSAFGYLRTVKVDYLKVDGSFIRQIHAQEDNRFFLRSIAGIAHSLDMRLIAESVEDPRDWEAVLRLGVDGGRGFVLGRPE